MKSTGALKTFVLMAAFAAYPLIAQEAQHNDSKPDHGEVKPAPQAHPADAKPESHPQGGRESRPANTPKAQPVSRGQDDQRTNDEKHAQGQAQQQQRQQRDQQKQADQQHATQQHATQQHAQQQQAQQRNAAQSKVQDQKKQAQQQQQQRDRGRQNQENQKQQAQRDQNAHREPNQRAQNSPPQRPVASDHRRIPDDRFREHFGRDHHFRVSRPTVSEGRPRFQYSGYWFDLVDPWPAQWSYDDDCYIDYVDDEYYLFDPEHPGLRIAINIEF